MVGNNLEVEESLACLRGGGPPDLRELVVTEGGMLLFSAGKVDSLEGGKQQISEALDSGSALERFRLMLIGQGVQGDVAQRLCGSEGTGGVLPKATTVTPLRSEHDGWVRGADAKAVGLLSQGLGAGRSLPDDELDLSAGVEMLVGPGDKVEKGQVWAQVHHSRPIPDHLLQAALKALDVAPDKVESVARISSILMET